MTDEEQKRLRAAEASAWASRKTLSLLMLCLEKRGVLNREQFFQTLDAEHLADLETAPILGDASETEKLIVASLRYICGPPKP